MPFNIAKPCLIIQSYLHYLEFVRYYRPQSRSHQEKTEYFFCQSYPSTFHSHHTNQIKGSTEVQDFLLKGTHGRILASLHAWMWARTHALTHTHCTFTRIQKGALWTVTNRLARVQERSLLSVAKSTHLIHQLLLGIPRNTETLNDGYLNF